MSRRSRFACVSGALALALAPGACESVSVVVEEVATVQVQPSTLSLEEGASGQLSATPRADGGQALSGRSVSWRSEAPLVVAVDEAGRVTAVGPGEGRVVATVEGISGQATVTVTPGPAVALDRDEVGLGADAGQSSPSAVLQVTNGGGGSLTGLSVSVDYPDGEPAGWLAAALGGTAAPTTLTLTASAAQLEPGVYEAQVTLRSTTAPGRDAVVRVTFDVDPAPPTIVLETDLVALAAVENGQEPAVQSVAVTNGGAGALVGLAAEVAYADGEPTGWLVATLEGSEAPTVLRLGASPTGLPPGVYQAVVTVSSTLSIEPAVLEITFTVAPAQEDGP